ncbi:MAG: cytochrome c oxidase assembly protein, partial [Actinobacteria bacterium]|nr:cytochrome c oxidase assembly protein [Actinomycetota bacterium]
MIFAITHILFATLTIGSLIALVFLLPEREGRLENQSRIRRFLPIFAGVWFLSALGQLISTLAALFDTKLVNVLDLTMIRSYVTQTSLGRLQFAELAAAGAVFIFQGMLRKVGGAFWLLLIALMGIIAPVFQSHSSNLGSHGLATGSLVVHVAAIVSWVGAVSAFAMMEERYREIARPRVAITASWSAIAIALSGMANAWTRLRLSSEWLSSYGAILITKITLYLAVLLIARKLRAKVATSKLLYFEVSLLIIIISLGSILNRFVPIKDAISVDRSQELIGIAMPPAPTWTNVSLAYEADGLIIGVLVFAIALYIKGVLTLSRRGISWPKGRTLSFAIGIALIDFATSGGVGLYSHFSFGFHMIAHMILSMIAPIALVLSAPITLALRALP